MNYEAIDKLFNSLVDLMEAEKKAREAQVSQKRNKNGKR